MVSVQTIDTELLFYIFVEIAFTIMEFIQNELVAYCKNGEYICDEIGFGANQIKE